MSQSIEAAYALARQRYADLGVDTDAALQRLSAVSVSLHCWQGDDVHGFEQVDGALGGGLAATGDYPGRARTAVSINWRMEFSPGTRTTGTTGKHNGHHTDRHPRRKNPGSIPFPIRHREC